MDRIYYTWAFSSAQIPFSSKLLRCWGIDVVSFLICWHFHKFTIRENEAGLLRSQVNPWLKPETASKRRTEKKKKKSGGEAGMGCGEQSVIHNAFKADRPPITEAT